MALVHNEQTLDEVDNMQTSSPEKIENDLPIKIKPKSIWERSKSDEEQQLKSTSEKVFRKAKSVSDAKSIGLFQDEFISMESNTLSAVPTIEEDESLSLQDKEIEMIKKSLITVLDLWTHKHK